MHVFTFFGELETHIFGQVLMFLHFCDILLNGFDIVQYLGVISLQLFDVILICLEQVLQLSSHLLIHFPPQLHPNLVHLSWSTHMRKFK